MLHGDAAGALRISRGSWDSLTAKMEDLPDSQKNDDGGEHHEVGIEKKQHASVVETPSALKTARCFRHAPTTHQQGKNLPRRAVKVFDVGKTGEAQAAEESAEREHDGAHQRALP